tara:strand:- start:22 stop:300 length:279 start_codon:yes stop_codon:yes gene_type:complete
MMTKKHFIKIAEIIRDNKAINFSNPLSQKISLIDNLGNYFKTINNNFDKDKFSSACLGGSPEIKKDKIYISEEDKLMRDKNIKWTQSEIIKN